VKKKLSDYTALDGFLRNYSVDLSGLIRTRPRLATTNSLTTNVQTGPTAVKLAGGGELAYWRPATLNSAERLGVFGFNPELAQDRRLGYASLTERSGTTFAFGYGLPAHFSYAKALYGNDDFARLSSELGVMGLSALAQGGALAAFGMPLNDATRIAVSWSGTPTAMDGTAAAWNPGWTQAEASASAIGLTHRLNRTFTLGMSAGILSENHGLLGTAYDASSPLSLGAINRSRSFGVSAGVNLDSRNSVLFEAGVATTAGASAGGLFGGTTDLVSRSYGATFMSRDLFKTNDRLMLSVKQPLRVVSGQAGVIVPAIDQRGVAHFNTEWADLAPAARELHYALNFDTPISKSQSFGVQAGYRKDLYNIAGNKDVSVGAVWSAKF
jgi:hypothetical protein